ncbi:30S ribosomal protein S24e [Archaeoglobus sp.]
MEVVVEKDRYNPLLKRREIHARITFWGEGATPTRKAVREKFAGLFNAELDRIVVDYIKTEFGKQEVRCYVKIYDTPEDLKAIEEEHIIRRNFREEQGEGEQAAQAE